MFMYQRAFIICCLFIMMVPLSCHGADTTPLRVGIMPFNSTLALFKTHQPLRQHLQNVLGRKVDFYTSPDYEAFLKDSLEGQFDLLITGPHFAVMSMKSGYQPLFHYKAVLQPLFVVKKESSIVTISDLKRKKIGLSSRLSISSIGGLKWLEDHGLKVGRDFQFFERPTHGAAVAAVAIGELDAALTTFTPLKQVPEDIRSTTKLLVTDIKTPHLMTLAHARLGIKEIERIRAALLAFQTVPAGKTFFQETGYIGYEPVTATDIKKLQPYIELTRRILQQKGQ
ncbi:MAG: PhnD/SsuA/transferrin family substrate-binding protein [Geobacter sp.]|nr:PhnD/SsuA/transferrin family substrate-binding protein [Geobacter sp.]